MDYYGTDLEDSLKFLFRRCVQCPNESPSCPDCASDETCSLSTQTCSSCPSTSCVKTSAINPSTTDSSSESSSSSKSGSGSSSSSTAGAIAGGVIGGIAFICIVTFLIWKFCIKNKRKEEEDAAWNEEQEAQTRQEALEKEDFTMQRNARASTHTVASIASTVLTRASNIIQIAYIPGVTNRSPVTPVPPVPRIPGSAMLSPGQDQHFFMPGDIRDSTWSGVSDDSYRDSIAPRSSVATTIYRNNAIISPVPATTALRGKAAVVSVKSGHSVPSTPRPSTGETPPLPTQSSASALASQKSLTTSSSPIVAHAVTAKAVNVSVKSRTPSTKTKKSNLSVVTNSTDVKTNGPDKTDAKDKEVKAESSKSEKETKDVPESATPVTVIEDSPSVKENPFSPTSPEATGLPQILEEKRSSEVPSDAKESKATTKSGGKGKEEEKDPFSDKNEVKGSDSG